MLYNCISIINWNKIYVDYIKIMHCVVFIGKLHHTMKIMNWMLIVNKYCLLLSLMIIKKIHIPQLATKNSYNYP